MRIFNKITIDKDLLIIGLLLLIIRIPFFLTYHIQEDAFISWRCAKNIIDYGVYGFNPGEAVSASSTHLYVFISAIIYFLFKDVFITAILVLNSIFLITATFLISKTLFEKRKQIKIFWIVISVLPISLVISYSGMETPLLPLAISVLIYNIKFAKLRHLTYSMLLFLPFIRPDALLVSFIYLSTIYIFRKRIDLKAVFAIIIGFISFLAFNKVYFGSFLNQSVIAKSMHLQENSLQIIFENIYRILNFLFLPVATKYLMTYSWIFIIIYLLAIIVYSYTTIKNKTNVETLAILFMLSFLYPLAYGIGGAMFPWYFWPSQFFIHCIIAVFIMKIFERDIFFKKGFTAISGIILLALITGQWVLSLNTGTQEFRYRAGIGSYINSYSKPEESIMLEPIGYIPFFADRYTHDEIGLASPNVTRFRKQFGEKWWIAYVKKYEPDYLIERDHILNDRTLDNYLLGEDEKEWFNYNYEMIKHFKYNPDNYSQNHFILYFLRLGGHADYYLFKRKVKS